MYEMPAIIRYSQVGADGVLSLKGLLDLLQDCCTAHSDAAGVPLRSLIARHQGWLLATWQIDINRLPTEGEAVAVRTSPYRMGGCLGFRSFGIFTGADELLCAADSMWVFADTLSGKPIHVPPEQTAAFPSGPQVAPHSPNRPIRTPDNIPVKRLDPLQVLPCLMDSNRHMNNSWYPVLAQGCLPEGSAFRGFRVEYKKPAHAGDWLVPEVYASDESCVVSLSDRDTGDVDCMVRFDL